MQDSQRNPGKRRRLTVSRATVVLLLVAVCAFVIFRLSLRLKLNGRIAAIRAAGHPVTCAELDEWYAVPEGAENAAHTIREAFSYYVDSQDPNLLPIAGQAALPARTEPLTGPTRAAIARFIADNKKALDLLHAGAAIESCRYPVDLTAGYETLLPDLAGLKRGFRLLNVEAISHADSDPNLSVRSVVASFGLARSLEKEPIVVSQIVRITCQDLAVSTLERLVNGTDFTDKQLSDLSESVVAAQAPSALSRAFVGERCLVLAMLERPPEQVADAFSILNGRWPKSRIDAYLRPIALALRRLSGLTDRSAVMFLDLMEDYVEAAEIPPHQRRGAIATIHARYEAASESDPLLNHVMGPLWRIDDLNARCIAHLSAARTALEIQRYKLAAGQLPDALSDLVPAYLDEVPTDPFDGNELRYKKLGSGFVVYSVGQDLSDDGGKEHPAPTAGGQEPSNWDVTFFVERKHSKDTRFR